MSPGEEVRLRGWQIAGVVLVVVILAGLAVISGSLDISALPAPSAIETFLANYVRNWPVQREAGRMVVSAPWTARAGCTNCVCPCRSTPR